jgi:hypothetical protein
MAATPYRSTCTIDGTKFDCVSISVAFSTEKDRAGMPQMGSLKTSIRCLVDFHDSDNVPYSTLNKLFNMANVVTRDKIKDMKVEFWKDDAKQDALCSYSFKGWISNFHTSNPMIKSEKSEKSDRNGNQGLNHMLILTLEPALNQQNFKEISISN